MPLSCLDYHDRTSYDRHKMDSHFLDWSNQPLVYKNYPGIKPLLLPQDTEFPDQYLSHLLKHEQRAQSLLIGEKELARIFQLAYSLTAKSRAWNGSFYYRSAASAGALYPTELYVEAHQVEGLDDGLYHFSISQQALHPLRKWEGPGSSVGGPSHSATGASRMIFFLTAILFRSSWKYRDRAFRYHLLDTGHVLENLILSLKSFGFPLTLSYDFDDRLINRLLGLDPNKEPVLAMVSVPGPGPEEAQWLHLGELPEVLKGASQVSKTEPSYPLIEKMITATNRIVPHPEIAIQPLVRPGHLTEPGMPIPAPGKWPETMNFPDTVINRRSRRNYVKRPASEDAFLALLEGLAALPDESPPGIPRPADLLTMGLLIGQVEGFEPGFYLLDTVDHKLGCLSKGSLTEKMAAVCLDQKWLANASLHFLFLADLGLLNSRYGPRGYRYALMTAGRLGERLYLLATAMGLGCCGIGAFYDREAIKLLNLDDPWRMLYLVAVGSIKSGERK